MQCMSIIEHHCDALTGVPVTEFLTVAGIPETSCGGRRVSEPKNLWSKGNELNWGSVEGLSHWPRRYGWRRRRRRAAPGVLLGTSAWRTGGDRSSMLNGKGAEGAVEALGPRLIARGAEYTSPKAETASPDRE